MSVLLVWGFVFCGLTCIGGLSGSVGELGNGSAECAIGTVFLWFSPFSKQLLNGVWGMIDGDGIIKSLRSLEIYEAVGDTSALIKRHFKKNCVPLALAPRSCADSSSKASPFNTM